MNYSVIYTADVGENVKIASVAPPKSQMGKLWQMTECGKTEYEDVFPKGKHRKWCALLNEEQFEAFQSHCCLYPENVETMGSLGAPGFGYGLAPAISFNGADDPAIIQNAYVTPWSHKKSELVDWLLDNGIEQNELPSLLNDDDNQAIMLEKKEKLEEVNQEKLWQLTRRVILEKYR